MPARNPNRALSPHMTMDELRERGWSNRLIKLFLGKPQRQYGLRKFRNIYPSSHVLRIESEEQFQKEKARTEVYAKQARTIVGDKCASLNEMVLDIELPLDLPSTEVVLDEARTKIKHDLFLEHLTENQVALDVLLDRMKLLEDELGLYRWHSGIRDARVLLKKRMLAHIQEQYPVLAKVVSERLKELATEAPSQ